LAWNLAKIRIWIQRLSPLCNKTSPDVRPTNDLQVPDDHDEIGDCPGSERGNVTLYFNLFMTLVLNTALSPPGCLFGGCPDDVPEVENDVKSSDQSEKYLEGLPLGPPNDALGSRHGNSICTRYFIRFLLCIFQCNTKDHLFGHEDFCVLAVPKESSQISYRAAAPDTVK
jgi:hypothetical protein